MLGQACLTLACRLSLAATLTHILIVTRDTSPQATLTHIVTHTSSQAAPVDEIMYPQPVSYGGAHLWLGQAGVLRLPQYRVVGLHSRANAVLTTLPFPWPHEGRTLWLNVAAKWYGGNTAAGKTLREKQLGCNEGCAAYVMVEVLDARGAVVQGYDKTRQVHQDVDEVMLPLAWPAAASPALGSFNPRTRAGGEVV